MHIIGNILIVGYIALNSIELNTYAKTVETDRNHTEIIQYYRDGTPYIGKLYQYYDQDGEVIIIKKPNKRYRHNIYPYIPKNSIINNGQLIRHHSSKTSK